MHQCTYLSILLVEYPDGGDSIDLDIVSADTSELFTEVVDESLGWFLVRVEDDALVSETDQLDVLHLEDVTVGGWTGHQGGMSKNMGFSTIENSFDNRLALNAVAVKRTTSFNTL